MATIDTELTGIQALRLEQATRLQQSVVASCLIVEAVILSMSPLFFVNEQPQIAIAWIGLSSFMVFVVFAYSKLLYPHPISEKDYQPYLRGHIMISCVTGSLWGGIAMYQLDADSLLSMYIATMITISITLGGMFPSSAYRATFIGILTCCVLPVAIYWFIYLPNPLNYYAVGFLVYYTFGLMASARTEINMRDLVLANQANSLNEQLQEQNKIIEKANSEKSRFMVATVHDFSQPLHAQGYFIHALRNTLTDQKQMDLLDRIETSWKSQTDLLQGISDISRIDGGFVEPRLQTIDVGVVIDEVASEFRADAQQNTISLELDIQSAGVTTDPALLTRILRNLLSNAFRNTPSGGTVTVFNNSGESDVTIGIRDTGVGIAPEDQQRIFDEYVQLENSQRDRGQGLGLGLTIVQRLTSLLAIELRLESESAVGTTFYLSMPVAENDIPDTVTTTEPAAGSTPLILLVDDERDIRDGMTELLNSWDCNVTSAASSRSALDQLIDMTSVPDLLIIDNRLGDDSCSGVDLIDQLRDEVNSEIRAVLMTGDIQDLGNLAEKGVTHLRKPVEPDALQTLIDSVRRAG